MWSSLWPMKNFWKGRWHELPNNQPDFKEIGARTFFNTYNKFKFYCILLNTLFGFDTDKLNENAKLKSRMKRRNYDKAVFHYLSIKIIIILF